VERNNRQLFHLNEAGLRVVKKYKKNSLLGTLNKIHKVLAMAKHMKEPLHSPTLYKSGDATITVQGKANKNAVTVSTTTSDNANKVPEMVKVYNDTKYGVDIVHQMTRKYTVRTSTRRRPVHSFHNTLLL